MIHYVKIMKGFVFIGNDELKTQKDLTFWVEFALQ